MPKISVCMPTYNRADRLSVAINSILTQSFTDFELVIVDDASKDDTEMLLGAIKDPRLKVVRNPTNQGVLLSRDVAYAAASGEYIALMDSDDIAYSRRLALQSEALDAGFDFVGSWVDIIDAASGEVKTWRMGASQDQILAESFFRNCFPNPAMMVNRRVLEKQSLSFVNDFFPSADYYLWSTLIRRPGVRFCNLAEPLLLKRNHPANVTSVHNEAQLEKAKEVRRRYITSWGAFSDTQSDLLLAISTLDPMPRLEFEKLRQSVKQPLQDLAREIDPRVLLATFEHAFERYARNRKDWDRHVPVRAPLDASPVRLTIVVTTFNDFCYLPQALTSVLSNAPADVEVIIVDDGSHDAILDVVEPYLEDSRVHLVRQQNAGLSAARNRGIELAQGRYICFLDADDYLSDDFFDHMLTGAEETQADVVVGAHVAFDEITGDHSIRFKPDATRLYTKAIINEHAKRRFGYFAQNKLYRRSLFAELRFWPGIVHEDELFCVEIFAQAESVLTINRTTYYYRQRQGSITKTLSRNHVRSFMLILARLYDLRDHYPRLREAPGAFAQIEGYLINGISNKAVRVANKADLLETEVMGAFYAARLLGGGGKAVAPMLPQDAPAAAPDLAKMLRRIDKVERSAHRRMDDLVLWRQVLRYAAKPWRMLSRGLERNR